MKLANHRRAGITLIELRVAISTITVLVSLTFVLFSYAERTADKLHADAARFSPEHRKARYRMHRTHDLTRKVPNQYTVTFKASVRHPHVAAAQLAKNVPVQIRHVYTHAHRGVSVRIQPGLLPALLADPSIARVTQDHYVYPCVMPTGIRRIRYVDAPKSPPFRIYFPSLVDATSPGGSTRPLNMINGPPAGSPATKAVAVIDTGIDSTHPELNVVRSVAFGWPNGEDQAGHGTHVSGTIGARGLVVAGVFPGVPLWSLRALGPGESGGTFGDVLGALDYVAAHADQISVCNMSIGGGFDQDINDAVDACTARGVVMCAAAGNAAMDASGFSPASAPTAICVAALCDTDGRAGGLGHKGSFGDLDDTMMIFSNYGTTVSVIAPGEDLLSTWPRSMGSYNIISGTSMATPHVSGLSALYRASPGILVPNGGHGPINVEGRYSSNPMQNPTDIRNMLLRESVEQIIGLAANGDSNLYPLVTGRP